VAQAGRAAGEPLRQPALTGGLQKLSNEPSPLEGGAWYEASEPGAAVEWRFPAGSLAGMRMLSADFLLDGNTSLVFTLELQEGDQGRRFRLTFAGLNQCSFRMRADLALTDQNRWQADREGAFLKPIVGGDRIDLALVDRAKLTLLRKADGKARFAMTPLGVHDADVPKLSRVALPKGPLVDAMGQSRLTTWAGKTRSVEEVTERLRAQVQAAAKQQWPAHFSTWGGWKQRKLGEGSGYFRVVKDDGRWWLADPEGHAFWSAGVDCMRVDGTARIEGIESALEWLPPQDRFADAYEANDGRRPGARFVSFMAANCIRAFGTAGWREKWSQAALGEIKRLRFNTVGNWSEWTFAARARFPYVRPLEIGTHRVPRIYRDFPDVFAPAYAEEAAQAAESLRPTIADPALIGYFLMNEPTWGFSSELPAAGMLYTTESCATRREMASFFHAKYPQGDGALAQAWRITGLTFAKVAEGRWTKPLTTEAKVDLREFSSRMVEHYFRILSAACKRVDPNHLNLGMRWAGVPPDWAVEGMKTFDVFSLNCYMDKLPRDRSERIHELLRMPVLVGEWHFGALDAGLPASGIGHVRTQADRGRAYRVYLDDAAANPNCVGVHWFTLYDQSALGRFDGENYNIGFLDICHRPYTELGNAAIASHERMYEVAAGRQQAFTDAPQYLPKLFL
jgi:hypothetical protein